MMTSSTTLELIVFSNINRQSHHRKLSKALTLAQFQLFPSLFRHVWESKADGAFAISEDTWNEPLGRGTEIRLHLRDEAGEYAEESKLKVRNLTVILINF